MELSKERIESLRELLAPANRKIVIVAHTNPDGDAGPRCCGEWDTR